MSPFPGKVVCVVGARPNFIKMAPLLRALDATGGVETRLVHTGQHYDAQLSSVFFDELKLRRPDLSLNVGSGSHGRQTGEILAAMEHTLVDLAPVGWVVVVGDVNSTLAAALAASKLHLPVAHVEAGLRSFDRSMPEEINRVATDQISSALFCSEPAGVENLQREGHDDERIHLVGNVMIDTLHKHLDEARSRPALETLAIPEGEFGFVTLHRPSNVDAESTLRPIVEQLVASSRELPIVFPVHPRTAASLARFGLRRSLDDAPGIRAIEPLGYLDTLCLTSQAKLIVTDSGGLQEESTALEIPCLTLRGNTERPITIDQGTNRLIEDPASLGPAIAEIVGGRVSRGRCPKLWDGRAAERIVDELCAR